MSQLIRYTIHIILGVIYVPGHWHPLWLCPLADTHTHAHNTHTQPEEPLRTVLYCAPTKMLPGMPRGIYLLRYWYIIMYYYESFPFSIVLLAWKYFDRPNGLEEGGFLCGKITPTPRLLSWLQIKRCGRWLRHGKRTYWRCVWENQLKDYRIHIL